MRQRRQFVQGLDRGGAHRVWTYIGALGLEVAYNPKKSGHDCRIFPGQSLAWARTEVRDDAGRWGWGVSNERKGWGLVVSERAWGRWHGALPLGFD